MFDQSNRILLVRRRDNEKWALPGGIIELSESVSDAVEREVLEETGLSVKAESLVGVYTDPKHIIVYADGEVRRQFLILCRCRLIDGTLQTDHESSEARFFSLEELSSLELSPTQNVRILDAASSEYRGALR